MRVVGIPASTSEAATVTDSKARARQLVGGVFDSEIRELEEIEAERLATVRHGDSLRAELQNAARDLDGIRDALAGLPARLQAAQLEADSMALAEIQDLHARLSSQREAAEARYSAAKREHDRDAVTPLDAARRASQRASAVKTRAEALAPAVAAELEAAIGPVLDGAHEISSLAHTLQAYR